MNLSLKTHTKVLNILMLSIAVTLIFRIPSTYLIIVFVLYNIINFKKINLNKNSIISQIAISLPLLIHILFIWNNEFLINGIKDIEKYICLLIFPIFIVGNYKYLKVMILIENYSIVFCTILTFLFMRYILFYPDLFQKYQNGIHQWEMGYSFANTFASHAPALNMHISFATTIAFYFLLENIKLVKNYWKIILSAIVFGFLFYFLLYVNTRLALINTLIAILLIVCYHLFYETSSKTLVKSIVVLFIVSIFSIVFFVVKNPYMIEKYTIVTFDNIDKIGKLDEIDNVQAVACNALVTRLSIWKTTLELINKKPFIGYGSSDSKSVLFDYYKTTNQQFLYRNKFPVHNQLLDFMLKFGILGALAFISYFFNIFFIGLELKNILIISFFCIFLISNFTDDFLIRFDGIVYSGFWVSCFASIQKQNIEQTNF